MNLEITPTKFDELCDHAEELEATVMRQEKELRRLREVLNRIAIDAGFQYNVTSDSQWHRIAQMAKEA